MLRESRKIANQIGHISPPTLSTDIFPEQKSAIFLTGFRVAGSNEPAIVKAPKVDRVQVVQHFVTQMKISIL